MEKQYKQVVSSYQILEQEGLDAIHETTLKLMEEFGVKVFRKADHTPYIEMEDVKLTKKRA